MRRRRVLTLRNQRSGGTPDTAARPSDARSRPGRRKAERPAGIADNGSAQTVEFPDGITLSATCASNAIALDLINNSGVVATLRFTGYDDATGLVGGGRGNFSTTTPVTISGTSNGSATATLAFANQGVLSFAYAWNKGDFAANANACRYWGEATMN